MTPSEEEVFRLWSGLDDVVLLRRGWPDFLVVNTKSGRLTAIEVKRPGCKPTEEQDIMHKALSLVGIEVLVIESDGQGSYLDLMVTNLRAMKADLEARLDQARACAHPAAAEPGESSKDSPVPRTATATSNVLDVHAGAGTST